MEFDSQKPPSLVVVQTGFQSDRSTQVESVSFSMEGLSVFVSSEHWKAKVIFEQSYGFRVLDELDLTEFWSQCSLLDGWVFEVTDGGWKTLELSRPHFISGRDDWVREYLVIGLNECVSVLTKEDPLITATAASLPE